jgi:putative membrane-bound dehydrogenase-like protein
MNRNVAILLGIVALGFGSANARQVDDFPPPHDSEPGNLQPMSAAEAAAAFQLPPGFRVSVFAAEPDVRNPIACAWDSNGRLWIAENYTYAERTQKFDLNLRDRVLIFEDRDGDGRHDRRVVFTDDVQRLTSVEVGRGGVWLMCPPQVLFIPDRDGDDVADGPAEVVLDGFQVPPENYHNFANGLRWGPDGWLYGRCGASAPGEIGVPGTPAEQRVPLRGGLWRYHPARKVFEALTSGTTNPWGHDWNEFGEAFFINTVNGHLWHAVAGMHFTRPHTIDPNPHVYELIDLHADHWHFDNAKDWTDSRSASGEHDRRGGGHAHSGMIIYQGDNWPATYRGALLTLNLHGRRINMDRLERSGSGYVGRHEPDPVFSGDPWFRGIDLTYGPDGGVYVLDWSDTGECHENTGVHRTSGRIYKITWSDSGPMALADRIKDQKDLEAAFRSTNAWFARRAHQVLADKAIRGESLDAERNRLRSLIRSDRDASTRVRALGALHTIGGADQEFLLRLTRDDHEAVRAWAVRLLTDVLPLDTMMSRRPGADVTPAAEVFAELTRLAGTDPSGLVRLVLASTLQRLPVAQRAELAAPLLARAQDADDHNLPLLIWYGLIPLGEADPSTLAKLAANCELPATRRLIARRLAESIESRPGPINDLIAAIMKADPAVQADLLAGIAEGLRGRRKVSKPAAWDALAARLGAQPELANRARDLAVVFGDGWALDEVRRLALDGQADLASRRVALQTLIDSRPDDLRAVCQQLLKVRFLNTTAVRGLTLFDDPEIGQALAANYRAFHPSERPAVINALVSRPSFAVALLDQIATGKIPRDDLGAFQARQIRSFQDERLTAKLEEVWGVLRDSDADRRAAIASWKSKLTPEFLAQADQSQGRAVFQKLCASCHRLYGQGGEIGPDLTGSGRDNLDYLLENILDPSAVVTADYRMVVLATADGRVLNGIVKARNEQTVTLQTQTDVLVLERSAIDGEQSSTASLMPDGLLNGLSEAEVRNLFGYLRHRTQVPLADSP